jgi:hypothetical protein
MVDIISNIFIVLEPVPEKKNSLDGLLPENKKA